VCEIANLISLGFLGNKQNAGGQNQRNERDGKDKKGQAEGAACFASLESIFWGRKDKNFENPGNPENGLKRSRNPDRKNVNNSRISARKAIRLTFSRNWRNMHQYSS
jgi:hypothetical protein